MKLNKFLSLLLAFALCSFVFSGCGSSGENGESTNLPIEATEEVTLSTDSGTIRFKLDRLLIGDDAFAELEKIGENPY